MIKLSPSIMCADFSCLGKEIEELEKAGVDLFHFDINDGHFVPTITMGHMVAADLRESTSLPFEVHLQVTEPERQIDNCADAGVDVVIIHVEACIDLFRTIGRIKNKGMKAGMALNPITPLSYLEYILSDLDVVLVMTIDTGLLGQAFIPQTLEKIKQVREMIDRRRLSVEIEVDGCINKSTIPKVVEGGANILVLGTSGLFGIKRDRSSVIRGIRELAEAAKNEVSRTKGRHFQGNKVCAE